MKQSKSLILFALLLLCPFTWADYQTLLNSIHRPTIADVLRETTAKDFPQKAVLDHAVIDSAASIIAELEWAYPGAIYMPLGRDVVLTGDIIDAFYHSQGQPGRVVRLNASGQSLRISDDMIVRFIETTTGTEIKSLTKGPGYIFFDGSGYTLPRGSQSTKILTAVYNEYVRQGGQATELLAKFAFFNLFKVGSGPVVVQSGLERNEFLREQHTYLTNNPLSIPQKTFVSSKTSYAGSEWHSNFLLLQEMPDGSVLAPPPAEPNHIGKRQNILTEMHTIIETVAQTSFIAKVQARAKELSYEFQLKKNCEHALQESSLNEAK